MTTVCLLVGDFEARILAVQEPGALRPALSEEGALSAAFRLCVEHGPAGAV